MGIPNFYSQWLARHNKDVDRPKTIDRNIPNNVSSFSIDANGLIHASAQDVYNYGQKADIRRQAGVESMDPQQLELIFFNKITESLMDIIKRTNPTDLVVIAVDGTAPRAKINQQRSRRFKAAKDSSTSSDALGVRSTTKKRVFDPNCITPGTDMMIRLDGFIKNWIGRFRDQLPRRVIYSSHLVPGEGEHKIMDLMRSGIYMSRQELEREGIMVDDKGNEVSFSSRSNTDGQNYLVPVHLLYGLDADLVMLSLLAPLSGIYLIREDLTDIVIIDQVAELVYQLMLGRDPLPEEEITTLKDFVLISFLIGNDFLPHQPSMENLGTTFDDLLDRYRTGREAFISLTTEDGGIIWYNFGIYLKYIADLEPQFLVEEAGRSVMFPSEILQSSVTTRSEWAQTTDTLTGDTVNVSRKLDFEGYRNKWYTYTLGPKNDNTSLNMKLLGIAEPFAVTIDMVNKLCYDYMVGLAWVFHYYQGNWKAINIDWFFPYFYCPLISDLGDYTLSIIPQGTESEQISNKVPTETTVFKGFLPIPGATPWNPVYQLLAVLPVASIDLLPTEVRHLAEPDSMIADMYPTNFMIDYQGKNREHQGIALIPSPSMDRIKNAVSMTTKFKESSAEKYNTAETLEYDYETTSGIISYDTISRFAEQRRAQRMYAANQERRRDILDASGSASRREGYVPRGRGGSTEGYVPRGRGGSTEGYVPRGRLNTPRNTTGRGGSTEGYASRGGRGTSRREGYVSRGRGASTEGYVPRGRSNAPRNTTGTEYVPRGGSSSRGTSRRGRYQAGTE